MLAAAVGSVLLFSFGALTADEKIQAIDQYAGQVDGKLDSYRNEHRKCCDCFGTDTFYQDSVTVVKVTNYQSCFNVDFYYDHNWLVLVTIDGTFKRTCGYTEANYCWDSTLVRDYRARIYYEKKKVLKAVETGTKPCCEIRPCGGYAEAIDFEKKAQIFLKEYGEIKRGE